jgi:hypothetical protein
MRKIQSKFSEVVSDISTNTSDIAISVAGKAREDLLKQATLSLDFANNKYEVYEGVVDGMTQMPFNTALDFTRGSGATAQTAIGTIQEVLTDEQRLVGNREGLLIEEALTNYALYSEDFSQSEWDKREITVTTNATTAPDGTTTANKLTPSTGNDDHFVFQGSSDIAIGDPFVLAGFFKQAGYSAIGIGQSNPQVKVDLTNGSVLALDANYTAQVTAFPDDWYLVELFGDVVDTSAEILFQVFENDDANLNLSDYAGDGTSGVFAWGAQYTEKSTSYIPTAGTQVTRAADDCVRTLGDEFNPNQWSIYLDATLAEDPSNFQYLFNLQGSVSTDATGIQITNTYVRIRADDSTTYRQLNADNQGPHKYAIAFDGARYIIVRDGVSTGWVAGDAIGLTTVGFPLRLSDSLVSTSGAIYRDFRIIPTAISEAELITLTGGT